MGETVCWAAGFIGLCCRLKQVSMSLLSNQEEKNVMFSLPGPQLHVNRELIDQMSVTCASWRKGPSPMC